MDIDEAAHNRLKGIATDNLAPHRVDFEQFAVLMGYIQYDGEMTVSRYLLYLKDVSSYQHMYASLEGLKAVAAVLEKHGITVEQYGYLG